MYPNPSVYADDTLITVEACTIVTTEREVPYIVRPRSSQYLRKNRFAICYSTLEDRDIIQHWKTREYDW